ncbi:MAG: 3-oxoacyl-[acyl-carrier protein] reductase [Gammaproteobacteria bacterium]|jgi:3-oxoacyl-[acyl-carrier protein] reductase
MRVTPRAHQTQQTTGDTTVQTLDGKIALITGAGKNIGRSIALNFAAQGATILVNGRSDTEAVAAVVAEINNAGGQAYAAMGDVSDPSAVNALVERAAKDAGGIDIVVSNAGLRRKTAFLDMHFDEWREILSVALDGAFLLAKATAPHMIKRGGGSFLALSGISTHIGTLNRCHVSASKAGLEGFVRAIARELAPHNITCNCIAPGAIDTERGASAGPLPSARAAGDIPLGRSGTVDEIAATASFLASAGGAYITGQTIHVNGGAFLT